MTKRAGIAARFVTLVTKRAVVTKRSATKAGFLTTVNIDLAGSALVVSQLQLSVPWLCCSGLWNDRAVAVME